MDQAVRREIVIVGVEPCRPGVAWVSPTDRTGVVPIGFGHVIPAAIAVDDHEMTTGWIVDFDFRPAAESGDGADGGEKLAELFVGHRLDGCCGLPDGIRGGRRPALGWVGSRAGFCLRTGEMERLFDPAFDKSSHTEWNRRGAMGCVIGSFREPAALGSAIFQDRRGKVNGIQDLDPAVLELFGGFDAIKESHQGEQWMVGVWLVRIHFWGLFFRYGWWFEFRPRCDRS